MFARYCTNCGSQYHFEKLATGKYDFVTGERLYRVRASCPQGHKSFIFCDIFLDEDSLFKESEMESCEKRNVIKQKEIYWTS